ncbi:GNAT family N-acetyltransferase [Nocardia lijiangensis]|uniref:GNAT family N-acetyltransferase n=1 Tax=Nocardia lijiangensis TaxID=299618 RepID=UPI000A07002F|nr:GNAT family N-acetyltransferase [Nocardia lijiangensis]
MTLPPNSRAGTVEVRPARFRAELREFQRWHRLCGVPHARRAARNLLHAHDDKVLSTGLTRDYGPSARDDISAVGGVSTVLAARTMALVALAEDRVVGGLAAGPSIHLVSQLAVLSQAAVVQAALATIKIHALAVLPAYRGRGLGRALLTEALTIAANSGARIIYGQFPTYATGVAAFYRRCGMNLCAPGLPVDLRAWADLPAVVAPLPEETLFHRAVTQ